MSNNTLLSGYSLLVVLVVLLGIAVCYVFDYSSAIWMELLLVFGLLYVAYRMEQKQKQCRQMLKNSADEKTFLLKEMHHRIKNNMQVMMGLLETQSFKIHDPKYKRMFQNHVDRIKAMSYLHQNLYDETSRKMINMHEYLGSIIRNLQLMTSNAIHIQVNPCELDMQQALNVGLIVNEAVSNAIKYAYDDFNGTIDVTLSQNEGMCMLHIQDFGKGYDPTELGDETLGVSMIEDMAAFLNESSVTVNSEFGVSIVVMFAQGE
jgi:two-component sensor histidine kinase